MYDFNYKRAWKKSNKKDEECAPRAQLALRRLSISWISESVTSSSLTLLVAKLPLMGALASASLPVISMPISSNTLFTMASLSASSSLPSRTPSSVSLTLNLKLILRSSFWNIKQSRNVNTHFVGHVHFHVLFLEFLHYFGSLSWILNLIHSFHSLEKKKGKNKFNFNLTKLYILKTLLWWLFSLRRPFSCWKPSPECAS